MSSERTGQYEVTERILEATPDAQIVANLGIASYVLAGVEDRPKNFYQWGSMASTTPIGLGLALTTDETVTAIDGDGSALMSLGAFVTVAARDPENFVIVVTNNDVFMTTGGQESLASVVDFAGVARESGLHAAHASTADEFEAAYREAVDHDGAAFVVVDVEPIDTEDRMDQDYNFIKRRFREATE